MSTVSPVDDVVRLLEEDHRLVEQRFAEVSTAGASTRGELFWKLTNDLVRHEVAEEVVVYPALRKLPGGDQIADARIAEQSEAEEQLAKMEKMDAESPEFVRDLASLKAPCSSMRRRRRTPRSRCSSVRWLWTSASSWGGGT